jgi:hypothetical protein
VRWAAIEQSRHGCRRSRAEEWIPSWRRFAKMANQEHRSVLRRGAAGGLIRGRSRLAPLSRSVSATAHDFRNFRLQSRSDKSPAT